ncbi:MAG TPA: hypothetical protein VGU20_02125 [Stellaceae bacterium]|nr:hypothetical protein [Stellaceae bacterium]
MRRVLAMAALLLLAACGGGDESELTPETIVARFVPGGLADVIVVTSVDRLPLRAATLVAPDGERVPAYSIDVDPHPATARVPGEATLLSTPGTPRQSAWINTMASTALIRLPDPVQYAKNWRSSRIELRLGDPGSGERAATLAAPPSPPI